MYGTIKEKRKELPMNDLINIVSTVGFPIGMCIILMWYVKDLTDKHRDESKEFTKALNDNTAVIRELCNILHIETRGEDERN